MLYALALSLLCIYFIFAVVLFKGNRTGEKVLGWLKKGTYPIRALPCTGGYASYLINEYEIFCTLEGGKIKNVSIHSRKMDRHSTMYVYMGLFPTSLANIFIHMALKKQVNKLRSITLFQNELDDYVGLL